MDLVNVLAGLGVGFVVGLTGVGGGSLMTPLLVLLMGVAPHTAVGTDLLYASATKMVGVGVHNNHGTVDWGVVRRLAMGSLPAAVLTLLFLHFGGQRITGGVMMFSLGVVLVLTSLAMLFKERLHDLGSHWRTDTPQSFRRAQLPLTILAGAIIGLLVTLTSVGAGALGTVMLVYLYPFRLTGARLVGTDLAHAIPLTLVAGFGHLLLGNIDFGLLGNLLLGSVPGVIIGSLLSARAPEHFTRYAIAVVLLLVGVRLVM